MNNHLENNYPKTHSARNPENYSPNITLVTFHLFNITLINSDTDVAITNDSNACTIGGIKPLNHTIVK